LLDVNGDPDTVIAEDSIANTGQLDAAVTPAVEYFAAPAIWPAFKNYSAITGAADNAYFEVTTPCNGLLSDIYGDCIVDMKDLKKMTDDWLKCNLNPSDACP